MMSSSSISTSQQQQQLIETARLYQQRAYCPYSKFKVGCAVLCGNGQVFGGCNVENAAFGGTICAERCAYTKAISEGQSKFQMVVVSTDLESPAAPCGNCRQFMVEFGDVDILLVGGDDKRITTRLSHLLPMSFGYDQLKAGATRS